MSNVAIEDPQLTSRLTSQTTNQLRKVSSPTWALCWKQWHELLSAMAMITLGSLVLLIVFGFITFKDPDYYSLMVWIPIAASVFFTFAACFIAFVSENENRTRSFLVNLPLSSFHVGVAKILMILVAIVAFCAGQALIASAGALIKMQAHGFPDFNWGMNSEHLASDVSIILMIVAAVISISLLACSFCSNPWAAVFLAFVSIIYFTVAFVHVTNHFLSLEARYLSFPEAIVLTATLVLILLGGIWFPLRWLRRQPWRLSRHFPTLIEDGQSKSTGPNSQPLQSSWQTRRFMHLTRGGKFRALVWQSFRQQHLVVVLVSFVLGVLFFYILMQTWGMTSVNKTRYILTATIPVMAFTGFVAGWLTLYQDKKDNNFEFFQQHHESGIKLLIARVLSSFSVLGMVIGGTILAGICLIREDFLNQPNPALWQTWVKCSLMAGPTFYSAVLFCSMMFRSHVYALGVALVVGLVATPSIGAPIENTGFAWMFALPLIWLLSSIFYGPAWLSGKRSWAWPAYFTVVMAAAFAVPIYLYVCWLLGIEIDSAVGSW